jgi:hypothetical protein
MTAPGGPNRACSTPSRAKTSSDLVLPRCNGGASISAKAEKAPFLGRKRLPRPVARNEGVPGSSPGVGSKNEPVD